MQEAKTLFKDTETIVGYLTINTGSLLLTDGVWADNLSVGIDEKITIDLGMEKVRLPIVAAKQSGQRFILIPIDRGITPEETTKDSVIIEDQDEESK